MSQTRYKIREPMKKAGLGLLFLGLLIHIGAGAHLLDSHVEWDRECKLQTSHFCSEVNTHDGSLCAICLVCTSPFSCSVLEMPELLRIELPFFLTVPSEKVHTQDILLLPPRGPPGFAA
jgi:hypothetical protein